MSDWRAADFVAGASPTGIVTSPKLSEPFQVVRMLLLYPFARQSRRTGWILGRALVPFELNYILAGGRTPHHPTTLGRRCRKGPREHGVPRPARRPLARDHLARGRRACDRTGERAPGARRSQG